MEKIKEGWRGAKQNGHKWKMGQTKKRKSV